MAYKDVTLPEPPYDPTAALLGPQEPAATLSMNPRRFALWLFIVSIIMIFASMSSAYIVRKSEGNWVDFELPNILWASTAVLIISSFTVQMAWTSAKRDQQTALRIWMAVTLALGFTFLYMQWESWVRLVQIGVFLVGNPSGSFLYVITGLHAFHLITGLVYLSIMTIRVFRGRVHSGKVLDMELSATYWHFLDILWLVLFGFLVVNHLA